MNGFRHEIKLLIPLAEYAAIRPALQALTMPDPNAGEDGEYFIRSLYFDDAAERSYYEKLAGVSDRKKYRLRIYNLSDSAIKLECKQKRGDLIKKRSLNVDRRCAELLCSGDFSALPGLGDPLGNEIYSLYSRRGLKPRVIVDYDREAYLHPLSNTRLTFDKNLHAGISGGDIFDPGVKTLPIFPDGSIIFEIKYDDVLPKILQGVISGCRGKRLALSKFALCVEKARGYRGG